MNWQKINNWPYYVSDTGLIKNEHGRIIKQQINHKGYAIIRLCYDYIKATFSIHRLVAEAFLPNPDDFPQVAHIDNNKLNNKIENLKWTTNAINMAEANRDGLRENLYNKFRKLDPRDIKIIRKLVGIYTQRELADVFNVEHTTIWAIQNGKTYKHVE